MADTAPLVDVRNLSVAFGDGAEATRVVKDVSFHIDKREIVALAAGQANRCQYCLSAHTLIGKGAGLSAEAIAAARTGQAANALDDAIAGFARALVEQRGVVSADAMANYRRAGLDDGLILEVIANVALNTLTNYTNHIADTTVDFPVVAV